MVPFPVTRMSIVDEPRLEPLPSQDSASVGTEKKTPDLI